MNWLAQNWVWIAVGIGVLFFMTRMGGMGGCGMGHSSGHHHDETGSGPGKAPAPPAAGNRPGNLFDAVSGRTFAAGAAPLSTVYRGRAYYFESRENRDAFEAAPEKYLAAAPGAGQAIGSDETSGEQPRRRHGGC